MSEILHFTSSISILDQNFFTVQKNTAKTRLYVSLVLCFYFISQGHVLLIRTLFEVGQDLWRPCLTAEPQCQEASQGRRHLSWPVVQPAPVVTPKHQRFEFSPGKIPFSFPGRCCMLYSTYWTRAVSRYPILQPLLF